MKLNGKKALVTGASTGIGRAIATGMAREGADIIINYNDDLSGAEETAEKIRQLGRKAVVLQANIQRVSEINEMFRKIKNIYGNLDILVNNAAVSMWMNFFEITEAKWDAVLDTNLKGTFFCTMEAVRIMKETGGGSIINISTNCAELGVKNLIAYAASKGGVHAMTKQLAVELAQYNIRVNTFAPGPTNVKRNLRDDPDYDQNWGKLLPLGRAADPEEMIGPAVFLASDDSSYMTGQVFYVDGGWTVSGKIPETYIEAATKNAT